MKKRYRAAVALALVVMQLFLLFVPVSAADEMAAATEEPKGTWVEESFSSTTVAQDFATLTAEQLLERFPLDADASKNTAEIVSAVTRKESGTRDMAVYLYIYVPSGTQNYLTGTVAISATDFSAVQSLTMKKIDSTATLLKVRVAMTSAQYQAYAAADGYQIILDSFSVTWGTASSRETYSYNAVSRQLEGGKLGSDLLLTLDLDGKPTSWVIEEELELDVHLSAERYSTPESGKFSQVNSAVFLVPTSYFYGDSGKYLKLDEISYEASYYHNVPMVVVDSSRIYNSDHSTFLFSYNYTLIDHPASDPLLPDMHMMGLNTRFFFYRDSISVTAGSKEDVSSSELVRAYNLAKDDWREYGGRAFSSWIHASDYVPLQTYRVSVSDSMKTVSYADGASFWRKLFDGRLFGTNIDDSIDLKQIQSFDLDDYNALTEQGVLTTKYISSTYGLSSDGVDQFMSLLDNANFSDGSDAYTVVVLHFSMTNYITGDLHIVIVDNKVEVLDNTNSYYVFQSIIDGFKIIELKFDGEDIIKVVPTVSKSFTFIPGLESPDKLEDETYDPPHWITSIKKFFNKLKLILSLVLLFVLVVVVVWVATKIFKLIGAARDAFGRRNGGGKGGGGSG